MATATDNVNLGNEEVFSKMTKLTNVNHKYINAQMVASQKEREKQELQKYVSGDLSLLEKNMQDTNLSTPDLIQRLNLDPEFVNSLFSEEDGTPMTLIIPKDAPAKDVSNFKKDLLIYLIESKRVDDELQTAIDEYNKERQLIEKDMGSTARDLVIDCLNWAINKRAELQAHPDTASKANMDQLDHIISGFDFKVMMDTLKQHPSIIKNTLKDMHDNDIIASLGQRYRTAREKAGSAATLITFISNSPDTSFEEIYLPPDKYQQGFENLFMFSIIRHFAMTYWTKNTVLMHAMTISLLQQFIDNTLPEDLKEAYIDNISAYLSAFHQEN